MVRHTLRVYVVCAFMIASAAATEAPAPETMQAQATSVAGNLMTEIAEWLSSTFELPRTEVRPAIAFVPEGELGSLRHKHRARAQSDMAPDEKGATGETTVAFYDLDKRTIFLAEGWMGITPADQSILVHEMVHHIQNVGQLKFECPEAREKLAYEAQDRWLGRFGTSLEREFKIDPFTVLVSSACM